MSSFQKVIKYCAIAFAVILAVGIISGIATAVTSVISAATGASVFHYDRETVDYTNSFTDVQSLNIQVTAGQLNIKNGDTFRVEGENVTKNFRARVSDNGTLNVEDGAEFHFLWFNFNGFHSPDTRITVYLPSDFIAKDANISTGAGKATIDELHAEKLLVSTGAGNLNGSNMSADKVKIDSGVGTITFDDVSFQDAEFDNGVGNLNVKGELLGDSTIDCGV
jgi:DUF4097 and DUF4098 domain-containing protein YvlB